MLKAVVFDFDGTLVDTLGLSLEGANELAVKIGHAPFSRKDVEKFKQVGTREFVLKELGISLTKIPQYVTWVQKRIRKNVDRIRFFTGIKPLLRKLSKRYSVIILTSTPADIVKGVLRREKVDCIDAIFSGSSLFRKDAIIKKLLKKHGLKREEMIYVGDEIRDVEACKKAGVRIISVSYGFTSRSRLLKEEPDYLVDSPREILGVASKL